LAEPAQAGNVSSAGVQVIDREQVHSQIAHLFEQSMHFQLMLTQTLGP